MSGIDGPLRADLEGAAPQRDSGPGGLGLPFLGRVEREFGQRSESPPMPWAMDGPSPAGRRVEARAFVRAKPRIDEQVAAAAHESQAQVVVSADERLAVPREDLVQRDAGRVLAAADGRLDMRRRQIERGLARERAVGAESESP